MKKLTLLLGVVASMGLFSCAGDCAKQQECAKKKGDTYSATYCDLTAKISSEQAQSVNCGTQYNDYVACTGGLSCDKYNDAAAVESECGAKRKAYQSCICNATQGSGC